MYARATWEFTDPLGIGQYLRQKVNFLTRIAF